MSGYSDRHRVKAVLGPTNTGKTHLAVERMLAHDSGMIGCPLRLLARELYDKVSAARGAGAVALITGEEKIVPPRPRYFLCTVEAMPLDRQVAFVAVDEIQLAADPDRGHVFTDRLLRMRGLEETMFLGAATIAPLIRRLVPDTEFVSRPRFSSLTYAGETKVTRLPPHTAVVAFSAPEVYALGEHLRRLRGGAAVVLGALSPRTRNAQVAMYQAGEVDYLVATDAIGMGLNMNVDHVAFAATRKFDGRDLRPLRAPEIAQIAGRAGRHMRDGTFGTTTNIGPLDGDIVNAVEHHEFPPLTRLFWRNPKLDFRSVRALIHSLDKPPSRPELIRPRDGEDIVSLRALAQIPEIAKRAAGYDQVSLLWEVCRIPDFRKTISDAHIQLLASIYRHLSGPKGRVPDDWVRKLLTRLDRPEGDIDTIAGRIAHVRTWNYVAHRTDWVTDAPALQERARAIEDRLSDALHHGLTQRFVDRRAAALVRGLRDGMSLAAAVRRDGSVLVEGEPVGRLTGLSFRPDDQRAWRSDRLLRNAVRRALREEWSERARDLTTSADDAFAVTDEGALTWRGAPVARLVKGSDILAPGLTLTVSDMIEPGDRTLLRKRLESFLAAHLRTALQPLFRLRGKRWSGPARGIGFQLAESLGVVARPDVEALLAGLGDRDRAALAGNGVVIGRDTVFVNKTVRGPSLAVRRLLWSLHHRKPAPDIAVGTVSCVLDPALGDRPYRALGFTPLGGRAVRVDMMERLIAALDRAADGGPFAVDPAWPGLIGVPGKDFAGVIRALGYHPVPVASEAGSAAGPVRGTQPLRFRRAPERRKRRRRTRERADSPFAVLRSLKDPS